MFYWSLPQYRKPNFYIKNGSIFLLLVVASTQAIARSDLKADDIPEIPAFNVVLSGVLAESLQSKRAMLLRNDAVISRDLLDYERLPRLGLNAVWSKRDPEPVFARNQSYGANLNYNLYDFGRTAAKRSLADYEIKVRSLGIDEVNEEITWKTTRQYQAVLATQCLFHISSANMLLSKTRFDVTRDNYRRGLRPENDLVAAEADFGETRLINARAQAEFVLQLKRLLQLMGAAKVNPETGAKSATQVANCANRTPDALDELIRTWGELTKSASQVKREIEREQLTANRDVINAARRPNLGLRLTAERGGHLEKMDNNYTGQIELSWNLTWPGQFKSEREQLTNKREMIEAGDAIESRQRSEAVELALDRMAREKQHWEALEQQFKLRFRQYELTKRRYDTGKATAWELSNIEIELGRVRLERARADNTIANTLIDLAEAKRLKDPSQLFTTASSSEK